MSEEQLNNQFPTKWLMESNTEDQQKDIKHLHLLKEGFKIVDKQGLIYKDQQFELEKKPLAEQTKEIIAAGAQVVGKTAVQVAQASKYVNIYTKRKSQWLISFKLLNQGFQKLFGFLQKAGDKIVGNLSAFQETYMKYREQQKAQQEQEQNLNKSNIQENWEIIVSEDTPQEEIDQLKKQIEEDGGVLKITRVQKALNMQKVGSNLRIIQLQNSSESFRRFVENQPSSIRQDEFGLLDSSEVEMRGAIQIDDSQLFEQMKKEQEDYLKDQYFDWSRILSPNQESQQDQQQNNIPDQSECYVYRIDNVMVNQQSEQQLLNPNQYNDFMKVVIPQVKPNQANQMPQEEYIYQFNYQEQQQLQQQQEQSQYNYPQNNYQQNSNSFQYYQDQNFVQQNNQEQNFINQNNQQNLNENIQYQQNYYQNQMNQPQYNNSNKNNNQYDDRQLEEPMAN